jgi:hypothetical protein
LIVTSAQATPLGTIPTIQENTLKLNFDFRSDLWTSPYTYKESPVRIMLADMRAPIFKTETWSASIALYDESLNLGRTDFQLGQKPVFIGNSLQHQLGGIGIRKNFPDGAAASVYAAYSTASDAPWGSPRNDYFYGAVSYRTAIVDNRGWIFAIDQNENRGIYNGTPFPYFGVVYNSDEKWSVSAGFPFLNITYLSDSEWHSDFRLTPFGISYKAAKDIDANAVFTAAAALTVRSYLYDERPTDDTRLYYQEIFVELGVKRYVTADTAVNFSLGGSFDRRLYESERVYRPSSELQTIGGDYYGRLGVEFNL